jgi:predicted DNA-binding transcriptional regulator AlpA
VKATNTAASVPEGLADVALVDARQCAASAGCSVSLWYRWVKDGTAPQPVVREPRFTRWRMADVRQSLVQRAAGGMAT